MAPSGGTVTCVSGSSGETRRQRPALLRRPAHRATGRLRPRSRRREQAAVRPAEERGVQVGRVARGRQEFAIIFWKRSTDSGLEDVSFPMNGPSRRRRSELDACQTEIRGPDRQRRHRDRRRDQRRHRPQPRGDRHRHAQGLPAGGERPRRGGTGPGTSPVKIHTIGLGSGGSSTVLKTIAQKTGGTYREIPEKDLRAQ